MRDNLPKIPRRNECAILNLQTSDLPGSHWVAYVKHTNKRFITKNDDDAVNKRFIVKNNGSETIYFDSFGNIMPPKELIDYLGPNIKYNYDSFQNYNTIICGHLCLLFLHKYCKEIFQK